MSNGQSSAQIMKQYAELLEQVRNTRNIPAIQTQMASLQTAVSTLQTQLGTIGEGGVVIGPVGPQGPAGSNGQDGAPGPMGPPGPPGTPVTVGMDDIDGLELALDTKATKDVATDVSDGLMSSVDKAKLDGVATGANNYTHPTTHPPSIIAQDASNRFVTDAQITAWNSASGGGGATTVGAMTDVNTTGRANGTMLQWDTSTSKYIHALPPGAGSGSSNELLVTDYGAVAGTETDQAPAFMTAIEAAAAQKKVLRIPSGTYRITQRIVVTGLSDLVIVGDPDAIIQAPLEGASRFHLLTFRNCDGILLQNITLDGNYHNIDPLINGQNGLVISYGTKNVTVRDCQFKNILDTAIHDATQGAFTADYDAPGGNVKDSYTMIVNNRFIMCAGGYNNKGMGSRFTLFQGNFYNGLGVCVKIDGEPEGGRLYSKPNAEHLIIGNVIVAGGAALTGGEGGKGIGDYAFCIEEGAENVTIANNEIYGTGGHGSGGFRLTQGQTLARACKNIRLINNRFYDTQHSYALEIVGNTTMHENIFIEGNHFIRSTRGFFNILNSSGRTLKGLYIRNNVFMDWGTGDFVADGYTNTPAILLDLDGTNEQIEITGNTFVRRDPVYATGSRNYHLKIEATTIPTKMDLIIEGNTFHNLNNSEIVLGVTGASSTPTKAYVNRNKIIKGILNLSSVDMDVTDNYIDGGHITLATSSKAHLEGNTIMKGTQSYLVQLTSSTTVVTARNNRFDPAVAAGSIKSIAAGSTYTVLPIES